MSTFESGIPKKENKSGKVEHFPWGDVVLNLDYSATERDEILDILKGGINIEEVLKNISGIKDQDGKEKFYVKFKRGASEENIDFVTGRTEKDPLTIEASRYMDTKARYARASISNEIILAPKIKDLIASKKFQELVKKYGYSGLGFAEPILSLVDKNSKEKFVVYKNTKGAKIQNEKIFTRLAGDLSKLFLKNGIVATDLKWADFMVVKQADGYHLVLIDTEAYSEKTKDKN